MSLRPLLSTALVAVAAIAFLSPTAHASTPGAVQLTGNQLKAVLPPASYFGHGFDVDGPTYGSGNSIEHAPVIINPTQLSCTNAWKMFDEAGLGETALAFEVTQNAPEGQSYGMDIYQLANSRAALKLFSAERAKSASCRSYIAFSGKGDTQHVSQSVSMTSIGGHRAFLVTQSSTFSGISGSLNSYILVTIDGCDLFIVQTVATFDNSIPRHPAPSAVTLYMIGKVSALR